LNPLFLQQFLDGNSRRMIPQRPNCGKYEKSFRITPFPRTDSSHGFSDGYAERGEAVQDGHLDLELGNLTVEVSYLPKIGH
jgi:hypothetical protein